MCRLTAHADHLLEARRLSLMRPTTLLVNTPVAGLDHRALVETLATGLGPSVETLGDTYPSAERST